MKRLFYIRYLQYLNISNNYLEAEPDADRRFFFDQFQHLENVTQLILENNGLNVEGVDDSADAVGNATVLGNLRYLSLKNNNLTSVEDYFFYPLRDSPIKELNLQNAGVLYLGKLVFEQLPNLEHVDLFNNKIFTFMEYFRLAEVFGNVNKDSFKSLGFGGTNLRRDPYLVIGQHRDNLRRLNLSGNKIRGDVSLFWNMTGLRELLLGDNRLGDYENPGRHHPHLEYLDLSGNEVRDKIRNYTFLRTNLIKPINCRSTG